MKDIDLQLVDKNTADPSPLPPTLTASSERAGGHSRSNVVRSHKGLLLDIAYQDYVARVRGGEEIDRDDYCAQHPHMKSSLAKLLQLHSFLEENDHLTETFEYPAAGEVFLDFALLHELGEGAFAKVYLAEETKLGQRLVVVKLSRAAAAEAQILGRIKHPHIVEVLSIREEKESSLSAVCMPYLGSATLGDVLDKIQSHDEMPRRADVILEVVRDLPIPLDPSAHPAASNPILREGTYEEGIRSICAQIAAALAHLHSLAICHRDMKPSNVLLTPDGTPMLLDFNLSTDFRAATAPFGGTLPYMAPEVLTAVGSQAPGVTTTAAGMKADIFSFGIILYELLTGSHPFGVLPLKLKTHELRELLLKRQEQGVKPARQLNSRVDPALSDLIQRCLARDPNDRPASAAAIAEALRPAPAKPVRRRSGLFAAALLCILVVGALVSVSLLKGPTLEQQLQAGQESYRQGKYRETFQICTSVLQADHESAPALYLRARAQTKLAATDGNYFVSAGADYRAADGKSPQGKFKAGLGYCMNGTGDHSKALAAYQQAVKSGYENAAVCNNVGFCLMKSANFNDAVEQLDRAIQLDPNLAMPYHNRARIAMNQALRNRNPADRPAPKADDDDLMPTIGQEVSLTVDDGIRDIRHAIKLGEDSARVYFDAALLCAIASEKDRPRADEAIANLRLSLQRGLKLARIDKKLFASIQSEIAAANLVETVATPVNRPMTRYYLDPIID